MIDRVDFSFRKNVQTSPHHAELFATSYGSPTAKSSDSNHSGGMVCLWSLLLPQVRFLNGLSL